jgi:hypothetical protein
MTWKGWTSWWNHLLLPIFFVDCLHASTIEPVTFLDVWSEELRQENKISGLLKGLQMSQWKHLKWKPYSHQRHLSCFLIFPFLKIVNAFLNEVVPLWTGPTYSRECLSALFQVLQEVINQNLVRSDTLASCMPLCHLHVYKKFQS